MKRRTVAISIGCPAGVGPEVSVLGAARATDVARSVLVGDRATLDRAARLRRVAAGRIVPVRDERELRALTGAQIGWWEPSTKLAAPPEFGKPTREAGAAQLAWIDEATDLVRAGLADALVTGPVSKAVIADSGAPGASTFRGHTEHLAARLGASEVIMAFAGDSLIAALVTTHLAITHVPTAITKEAVATSTFWLTRLVTALRKSRRSPRIAIASLNPHAGESGLLGREEIDTIAPGIALARERLAAEGIAAELVGPIGAETAIRLAARGDFGGVVTMYHDQATIPSKLLGFGEAVNITLGLPIVRTSVDHGTAYDAAGTRRADPRGMLEAIHAAVRLVQAGIAARARAA
jgi:4-hydroxythreonine-4-phosphate dehydrogenase